MNANTNTIATLAQYEHAALQLLAAKPANVGFRNMNGVVFTIGGNLFHLADGDELADATMIDDNEVTSTNLEIEAAYVRIAEFEYFATVEEVAEFAAYYA
jgi:hypothetical protein